MLRPGGHLILARSGVDSGGGDLRARLLRRGLRRRGIELMESEQAGDGSFSFGRLRGDDPMSVAD